MDRLEVLNTLVYDANLCIGCGLCAIVCPHGVFGMDERVAQLVRAESCMECGACQRNCPAGAIAVESGVGCAAAMIRAALYGREEQECGCEERGGAAGCCSGDR